MPFGSGKLIVLPRLELAEPLKVTCHRVPEGSPDSVKETK